MLSEKEYVLSQYANSPIIMGMIRGFASAVSTENDAENFYNNIYNISTANAYGLNIWGKILNIPRQLTTADGSIVTLSNDSYRFLLQIRAMANISNATIPNLQSILNDMFKNRGKVYVFEVGTMKMKYVFDFYLTNEEKAIIKLPNIPPKPTGVQIIWREYPSDKTFGFNGTGFQPFNNGVFRPVSF